MRLTPNSLLQVNLVYFQHLIVAQGQNLACGRERQSLRENGE